MFIDDIGSMLESAKQKPAEIIDYQKLKLKQLFSGLSGNPRAMVITMPAFSFPQAWFLFYLPFFLLAIGVKESELGFFTALSICTQVVGMLIGPAIINRYGHKKTMNGTGIIVWPVGLLLLAFAQNVWWAIPGVIFINIISIASPAWSCLFVEGATSSGNRKNYAVVQMIITGASLSMFLAGAMVRWLEVETASRIFFGIGAAGAVWAIYYRQKHLVETKEGKEAVKKHKRMDLKQELNEFFAAFSDMGRRKEFLWFVIVQVLFTFGLTMWGVYNAVFLCSPKGIGLDKSEISVLPILMSVTFIFTILVIIPMIKRTETRKYIFIGALLNSAAAMLYCVAPVRGMSFMAASYMLYGLGLAFFRPLSDSTLLNLLSKTQRTRLLSLSNTVVLLVAVAAGPVAAWLYVISPKLNFAAVAVVFAAAGVILWKKCPLKA